MVYVGNVGKGHRDHILSQMDPIYTFMHCFSLLSIIVAGDSANIAKTKVHQRTLLHEKELQALRRIRTHESASLRQ
jgi:hypothetical protein